MEKTLHIYPASASQRSIRDADFATVQLDDQGQHTPNAATTRIRIQDENDNVSTTSATEDEIEADKENQAAKAFSEAFQMAGKASSGHKSPRLARTTRTIGFAKAWRRKIEQSASPPRVDSFLERLEMAGPAHEDTKERTFTSLKHWVIDPSAPFLYRWQVVVFMAVLYNWVFIIARAAFRDLHEQHLVVWLVLDYTCDIVYVLDMAIQLRTGKWVALLCECYVREVKDSLLNLLRVDTL